MYKVYWMLPKQHPVFVAEFEDEQYAQVLVGAGNKLYEDGREFWLEYEDDYTDQRMREAENHGMADKYETYPAYDPYAEYKSEIRSLDK